MARSKFKPAPEVEKIARELIREHHGHLLKRRVEFVFQEKAPKSGTKEIWGTARIMNGLAAFMANRDQVEEYDDEAMNEDFFVITISEPVWGLLSERCRKALIDHELCHCWVEEKDEGGTSLKLVHHDLEEFGSVVQRWGVWRDDLDRFLSQAEKGRQGSLFDEEESGGDSDGRADEIVAGLIPTAVAA
jgi:hypothetical protein